MSSSLSEGATEPAFLDDVIKMKHFSQTKVDRLLEMEGGDTQSDTKAGWEVLLLYSQG